MNTIYDNLNKIIQSKNDLKTSLNNKNYPVVGRFEDYYKYINNGPLIFDDSDYEKITTMVDTNNGIVKFKVKSLINDSETNYKILNGTEKFIINYQNIIIVKCYPEEGYKPYELNTGQGIYRRVITEYEDHIEYKYIPEINMVRDSNFEISISFIEE